MPRISKAKIVFFILMIEAILSLSFFNLYADTQPKPQRPWYSETPNPRHIANYDRLTAEYFNNQLNVIYNWAQNTNAELDNLLHNGLGVASLTVGILNCTNKIINPEWDNLLHNGNGVASITANLVKAQDLEIANSIDVPAIEFSGRSQPTPPVNNGMLYFDSDLQRFRVYQENEWRDLSSNIVIASDSLTNPLVIQGYISASNIYATESAVINKNLTVKGKLNASGPATLESLKVSKTLKVPVTASTTLGVGSVYYDTSENKLKILNSSNQWKTVSVDVDSVLSATSTNPVQNKIITAKINQTDADLINGMAATLQQSYNYANGIATQAYNYANNVASDAQTATQNYADTQLGILRSYVSQQLGSGTSDLYVKSIKTTNASVTNKLDAYDLKATNTFVLPDYNNVGAGSHASYFSGIGSALLGVDTASGTLKYTYYSPIHHTTYANNTLATVDKTVSDVATSTVNGTITVTKNGTATNVSVKGLGSAAYANVASFSAANHNHDSSYVSDIATGTASGTFSFTKNGVITSIGIKGLGDAAFTNVASISSSVTCFPTTIPSPGSSHRGTVYLNQYNVVKYNDGQHYRELHNDLNHLYFENIPIQSNSHCTVSSPTISLFTNYYSPNNSEFEFEMYGSVLCFLSNGEESVFYFPDGFTINTQKAHVVLLTTKRRDDGSIYQPTTVLSNSALSIKYENTNHGVTEYFFLIKGKCYIDRALAASWFFEI